MCLITYRSWYAGDLCIQIPGGKGTAVTNRRNHSSIHPSVHPIHPNTVDRQNRQKVPYSYVHGRVGVKKTFLSASTSLSTFWPQLLLMLYYMYAVSYTGMPQSNSNDIVMQQVARYKKADFHRLPPLVHLSSP